MTDCNDCGDTPGRIAWRDRRWCLDCFEEAAADRDASEDWVRLVLGKVVKDQFEPPLDATGVNFEARVDLLVDFTLLDEREARVQTLRERGYSTSEIAARLELDEETVETVDERIADTLERAQQTVDFLD